jgi:hypothetical protein
MGSGTPPPSLCRLIMFPFRAFPSQGLDYVCGFQFSASSAEVIYFQYTAAIYYVK